MAQSKRVASKQAPTRAAARDRKRLSKRKMRVSGKSVFTIARLSHKK